MNSDESRHDEQSPDAGKEAGGWQTLGQHDRLEYRLAMEGEPINPEARQQIIEDLKAYRDDNGARAGEPMSWHRLAELVGVSQGTLTDVKKGVYKGDESAILRKIDLFLADDRARAGRFDFRTHARIGVTEAIFGTIKSGIRLNSCPVIIGSQGTGKSVNARAFAADRGGVVTIRPDEAHRDARGVTKLLCNAIDGLRPNYQRSHSERLMAIKEWLRKHGSTVIIVDECQKLSRDGMEMLRDIHDISDPAGRRCVPVVFFGDHSFKKLIFRSRNGEKSPISPQTARRMRPVLDIDADCQVEGGGIYTVEDIVKIVRNNRVKLLSPRAARWLRDLANVQGYGAIGFAMGVLQLAVDLLVSPGGELQGSIDVDDLQRALEMTFGRNVAVEINEAADGQLLAKATA
jgi:hypothetical protein